MHRFKTTVISSAFLAGFFLAHAANAAECEFDSMVGGNSLTLKNFNINFVTYEYPSCQPERNGSLPCEEYAQLNSPGPAYIQSTKINPELYFWDGFTFGGYGQVGTQAPSGQAIVRRYEFLAMSNSTATPHLSFVLNGDAQGSFLTISQTLTTTRPTGINRKLPAGTDVTLRISPGANLTSVVRIETWKPNGEVLAPPIEFTTAMQLKISSVKRGNVVPMNFQGDGSVHFIY